MSPSDQWMVSAEVVLVMDISIGEPGAPVVSRDTHVSPCQLGGLCVDVYLFPVLTFTSVAGQFFVGLLTNATTQTY